MRSPRTPYWIATGLFAALMLLASVPDVLKAPQAVQVFAHLGYPAYLLPFLGTAKILGVITVVIARRRTIAEWAYAGLSFDLIGALYSHLSVGDPASVWVFPIIGMILLATSYALRSGLSMAATTAVATSA